MKLSILAVGHKMPGWIQSGIDEYAKRMPPEARIDIIELKPEDRANKGVPAILTREATRILSAIPKGAMPIALDEHGETITTKQLAEWFKRWMSEGINPCFIIGSADGLDDSIKKTAQHKIALSGFTLPHGLVRVMLVEQLYRAWSLLNNHPYHRE